MIHVSNTLAVWWTRRRTLAEIRHYLEDSEPHLCLVAFCIIKSRHLFLRWLTLGGEGLFEQCEQAFRDVTLWDVYELESRAEPQDAVREMSIG